MRSVALRQNRDAAFSLRLQMSVELKNVPPSISRRKSAVKDVLTFTSLEGRRLSSRREETQTPAERLSVAAATEQIVWSTAESTNWGKNIRARSQSFPRLAAWSSSEFLALVVSGRSPTTAMGDEAEIRRTP